MTPREVIRDAVLNMLAPYTPDTIADAILAALGAAGMAVVPVEATDRINCAGATELVDQYESAHGWEDAKDVVEDVDLRSIYRAMVAAAQAPGDG